MNYKDFTLKAKLNDLEDVEKRLLKMNSKYVGLDKQVDNYFETTTGKLKLRQGNIEKLITHYERIVEEDIEKTIVYRYEKNPSEDQINELRGTFRHLGTICKERKIYTVENIKIHLDKLPNGESFIEIEAIDRTSRYTDEELKSQCFNIKSKLGIRDIEMVRTGYLK